MANTNIHNITIIDFVFEKDFEGKIIETNKINQNEVDKLRRSREIYHKIHNIRVFWTESLKVNRPPLWSSGQSSWLHIQRSGFYSRRYQIFREVVCLERGSLGLVSATKELLERKSSGSGLERRECGRRDPSR
jgi:hypothetical protein